MDIAVPADHKLKLKENERKIRILTLPGNQKITWNMKVTVIPITIRALGTVTGTEGLGNKRTRGESRRLEETCCYSNY